MKAVVRATGKSLALSAAVLGPGLLLLYGGAPVPGMLWLFGGSFGMVAWSYRKPWRLGLVSCLIPPVAAALGYVVQLALFSNAAPPLLLVLGAVALGIGVGWYRGETHQLYVKEGGVFAQRTVAYLGIWIAAYAVTQLMALLAANVWLVRSGLITGAFTTAMLAAVSIIILQKRKALAQAMAALAFAVLLPHAIGLSPALAQPSPDEPEVVDILRETASKVHHLVLDADLAEAVVGQRPAPEDSAARTISLPAPSLQRISENVATATYATDASSSISVTLERLDSPEAATPQMSDLHGATSTRAKWIYVGGAPCLFGANFDTNARPPTAEVAAIMSKDRFRISVRAYGRGQPPRESSSSDSGEGGIFDIPGAVGEAVGEAMEELGPILFLPLMTPALAGEYYAALDTEALSSAGVGADPTPLLPDARTGDADSPDASSDESVVSIDPETIAAGSAAVAAILIAAGVAANIAQAIAAAIASALQSGVEMTSEEISAAIAEGLARAGPAEPTDAPLAEGQNVAPPPKPPPIYDKYGTPFDTNDAGQYWAPDEQGSWGWLNADEAREASAALRGEEAARERERADFARDTEAAIERSQAESRARDDAMRDWIAAQNKARDDLARIRQATGNVDYEEIYARSGTDRVMKEDGTLDTEYIQRLKEALRDRLGRDTTVPDSSLEGTSTADIVAETVANTADEAAKSMVVRMGSAVLTGGLSEIGFQGGQALQAVKKAVDAAVDSGRDFSRADAMLTAAKHVARENLPVNTIDALRRMRAGEDVSLAELGMSAFADLGAAGDIGLKPGKALDAFARNTLDAGSYDALSSAMAKPKGLVDGALERIGIKSADPDLPPHRLSPADARDRFVKGQTSAHTDGLISDVKSSPRPGTAELDTAFEQGRAAGREKVGALTKAVDDVEAAKRAGASASDIEGLQRRVRDESIRVQGDKHAMNELNKLPRDARGNNGTIGAFNREWDDIYGKADKNLKERLAKEMGVRPDDIQAVTITNMKGRSGVSVDPQAPARDHYGLGSHKTPEGTVVSSRGHASTPGPDLNTKGTGPWKTPPGPNASKASFDRDLTMRVRTVANGKEVWRDIPSTTTARIYNEELYKAARGVSEAPVHRVPGKSIDFKDTHLSPRDHLTDPVKINDADLFAKRMDQATTDRMHPEAYGAGQPDLDAATKDAFRGRDLIDVGATAKTTEFKVNHWMNEADDLTRAARQSADPAEASRLMQQAAAHHEEAQRQLVKQFDNMVIKRTEAMQALGNAPQSSIPASLTERINVLKGVQTGRLTPGQAEEVLNRMGTSTKQVSGQMSSYIEGLQGARPSITQSSGTTLNVPTLRGWRDDFQTEDKQ